MLPLFHSALWKATLEDKKILSPGTGLHVCGSFGKEEILKDGGEHGISHQGLSHQGSPRPTWLKFAEKLAQENDLKSKC